MRAMADTAETGKDAAFLELRWRLDRHLWTARL
jgi:hypothetical protein